MAVDSFIYFTTYKGTTQPDGETLDKYFSTKKAFEIKEFSFDVENPTTIGSATKGAGSGKIKFNEFTIKKTTDWASTIFFKNCVTGAHYETAVVSIRKTGGSTTASGMPFLEYCFGTVFTTKIEWSGPGDEGPEESITFSYGKLGIFYRQQKADGSLDVAKRLGWDQMLNKAWVPDASSASGQT